MINKKPEKLIITIDDAIDALEKRVNAFETGKTWDFEPVNIIQFVEDPYYMDFKFNPNGGGCWQCVMDDLVSIWGTDAYKVPSVKREAYFSEAIGTGKTTRLGLCATYATYKWLCLHNPLKYMNKLGCSLSSDKKTAILLISRTETNAKDVVFSDVNAMIMNSPWFLEHYLPTPDVTSRLEFDEFPKNRRNFDPQKIYKRIHILPGSSSEYGALGYNVWIGDMDEVTKFEVAHDRTIDKDRERDQAEILYSALKARICSRFEDNGLLMTAGNPEHKADFLERHSEDMKDREDIYIVRRRSIWAAKMPEFDPEKKNRDGTDKYPHFYFHVLKLKIVQEKLKRVPGVIAVPIKYYDVFKTTPEIAVRDYAGIPTDAVGRVLADPAIVDININRNRQNPLKPGIYPWPIEEYLQSWFKRQGKFWHVAHFDLGGYGEKTVGDAAGLCIGHPYGLDKYNNALIYIDLFLRFQGSMENPVQINHIIQWITYLHEIKHFHFGLITADSNQSIQALQALKLSGFRTEVLSVDRDTVAYDALLQAIREKRVDYYNYPTALKELKNLERAGKTYDHPKHGSKDLSDCWAGVSFDCMEFASYDPPEDDVWDNATGILNKSIESYVREIELVADGMIGTFPYMGKAQIEQDIFEYDGKIGNKFINVCGIQFPHKAGSIISLLPVEGGADKMSSAQIF